MGEPANGDYREQRGADDHQPGQPFPPAGDRAGEQRYADPREREQGQEGADTEVGEVSGAFGQGASAGYAECCYIAVKRVLLAR